MMVAGLKLVTVEKSKAVRVDPAVRQRTKFIAGLDEQIGLARDSNFTVDRIRYKDGERVDVKSPPRKWWFLIGGKVYTDIKYGNRSILDEGKSAEIGDMSNLASTYEAVKESAEKGEFDEQIAKAAVRSPRKK